MRLGVALALRLLGHVVEHDHNAIDLALLVAKRCRVQRDDQLPAAHVGRQANRSHRLPGALDDGKRSFIRCEGAP